MKRKQQGNLDKPGRGPHMLDARRLAAARGGDGTGIAVNPGTVSSDYISMQHNETLIRL